MSPLTGLSGLSRLRIFHSGGNLPQALEPDGAEGFARPQWL